jgi:signal transduction histidine kinase
MRGQWPLLLLALAVLLPTACVLWLINDAIRNQRLAVRQRLSDAYETQLSLLRQRLDEMWSLKAKSLDMFPRDATGFARIAKSGLADSAIFLNSAGVPVYPAPPTPLAVDSTASQPQWGRARQLENTDIAAAASAYIALGTAAKEPNTAARAFQAAARCLAQAGHKDRAANLIMERFTRPGLERATDLQGRAIAADALLMAVELFKSEDPRRSAAAQRLRELLLDYDNPAMSSAQRIFLMKELRTQKLPAQFLDFPTLDAEELAVRLLEIQPRPAGDAASIKLTALPDVWALASPSGRVRGLFHSQTIARHSQWALLTRPLPAGIRVEVLPPGKSADSKPVIPSEPASDRLPGWQLALMNTGPDPFQELQDRQYALYLWVAFLVTSAVVLLALIAVRLISRRLRLAGMKADLVAVVSHELKTPLSSMRLLVDTLLDDSAPDAQKTREYLELISRENTRLSLLIANFLAFSRMERNKYSFEFAPTRAQDVIQAAVEAAGERFHQPGCELQVEATPNLPEVRADQGALVAALVNLLDNAYKYTLDEKHITLRAFAENGQVCFEVRDNGIGIPAREIKKIFHKFYQADQRLSRTSEGCGLGLSIVHFLVEAHDGSVQVSSEPGKGSTFTVVLEALT